MKNIATCATQASPSWNAATVRRAGISPAAQHQPGEVDGEEARPVEHIGAAEGDRRDRERRHRVQPAAREPGALQQLGSGEARGETDREPDRELLGEQARHVDDAEAGVLDPLDESEHQQDRDGVVHTRLALERAGEAAPQRRGPQDREDGGRIGRGEHGPEQQALERREVEQPGGDEARSAPPSGSCRPRRG